MRMLVSWLLTIIVDGRLELQLLPVARGRHNLIKGFCALTPGYINYRYRPIMLPRAVGRCSSLLWRQPASRRATRPSMYSLPFSVPFAVSYPRRTVTAAIVGARSPHQLDDTIAAPGLELTTADVKKIANAMIRPNEWLRQIIY